jgi:hypothetical protein
VHFHDPALCKKRTKTVQRCKIGSARVVHSEEDRVRCKAIQGSATPYKKAMHDGALPRHRAVQKRPNAVLRGKKRHVYERCTVRTTRDAKGPKVMQMVQKKQCAAVHFQDTAWCKAT